MHQPLVRVAALSAGFLLQAAAFAAAQPALVSFRSPQPRQVQSAVFVTSTPQDIRIDAAGAEPEETNRTFSWIAAMWTSRDDRREPWMANAWILDLSSRKVVWQLSESQTDRGARGTRVFTGSVRLPAGTYEAFYAAFPNEYYREDNKDGSTARWLMNRLSDLGFDEFHFSIAANGRTLAGREADQARHQFESGAVVVLRGDGRERFEQTGFTLDRPTTIDVMSAGEVREDAAFDSGWIINADTRQTVWKLEWAGSSPAGGAVKNRVEHRPLSLPAGRYAAFYATDDSHDTTEWNSQPPADPNAWGLYLRVPETARSGFKTFAYEHVPQDATFAALTKIGDGAFKSRGFTLARGMDVRIYALGEGSRDRMVDYGWITDAATRRRVWQMRYGDTEHAGGDPKNRLIDETIHLDKGDYIVNYVSDDSHSYDDWNASAPRDARHWGITLLAARAADRAAVSDYTEKPDPSVLAQIVRVRDDQAPRARFALDRETRVRVYALGEQSGRGLADYGWIEDAKTGRAVWEMTYRTSDPAGGASKNRKFDGVITLPAGEYVLRYESDESHAFGTWNAAPPDDPEMWGITLFRVR